MAMKEYKPRAAKNVRAQQVTEKTVVSLAQAHGFEDSAADAGLEAGIEVGAWMLLSDDGEISFMGAAEFSALYEEKERRGRPAKQAVLPHTA
jgi:hypothetical protein